MKALIPERIFLLNGQSSVCHLSALLVALCCSTFHFPSRLLSLTRCTSLHGLSFNESCMRFCNEAFCACCPGSFYRLWEQQTLVTHCESNQPAIKPCSHLSLMLICCSNPGLLAALSRGLSRKRLQVSALPRQWIRLFNGLTV